MKTVIYYRSFFHGTEMYAKWLAEDLGADLKKFGWFSRPNFAGYDRVIIMSAMYAGWFPAAGFVKGNWNKLLPKDKFVIYCGVAAGTPEGLEFVKKQLPDEYLSKLNLLTLSGAQPFAKGAEQLQSIKREKLKPIIEALSKFNQEANK